MPILKKQVKKSAKEENIPMFHDGDGVTFDDGDGNILEGVIESTDPDAETATVLVDEDQYEVEFKELTLAEPPEEKPAKKAVKKKAEAEEKEEKKAKGGKKVDAFAEQLRKTKAASAGGFLADGDYEGLITEINYKENEEKGDSVGVKYTVVNNSDEDLNGKSAVSFYNVTTPEGEASQGLEYLKRDLISLGIEEDDLDAVASKEEFIDLLNNLAEEQKWVEFKVTTRKGFSNVFLQSVFEDQDEKPELE